MSVEATLAKIEAALRAEAEPFEIEWWRPEHPAKAAAREAWLASHGPAWAKPVEAEHELEALRRAVRALRVQLAALHSRSRTLLNQEADHRFKRSEALLAVAIQDEASMNEMLELMMNPTPKAEWATVAVERELARLEAACVPVIERVIKAGSHIRAGERQRPANWRERSVAFVIARYFSDVTGRPPGKTRAPDGLGGPYGRALGVAFDALGLPRASMWRAGSWALTKIGAAS